MTRSLMWNGGNFEKKKTHRTVHHPQNMFIATKVNLLFALNTMLCVCRRLSNQTILNQYLFIVFFFIFHRLFYFYHIKNIYAYKFASQQKKASSIGFFSLNWINDPQWLHNILILILKKILIVLYKNHLVSFLVFIIWLTTIDIMTAINRHVSFYKNCM